MTDNFRFAIRVEGVSLCYRLPVQRIYSLKEYVAHWVADRLVYKQLWALTDVSFRVGAGECVGIVGRNGTGKSTLLKLIARVLRPTRGSVRVQGSLVPLLEVGAGFDHELTGIENIYLNALLLGRNRSEIRARLDFIIEESGLGDFIRSPIRTYSTGMVARLGFSIAMAWTPQILLLDEILAVGDMGFVSRCQERLESFRRAGTTILLVSHDPAAIRTTCSRCIWLEDGRVYADGPTGDVLDRYLHFTDHAGTSIAREAQPA